jgi:putative acetyltransferase
MIQIRRIEPDEWLIARQLVYRVAHAIFNETRPLEEMIADYDSRGALDEMSDIQKNYFENGGIFLVMTDRDQIIGTGAIRFYKEGVCEMKRVWLLTEYHGRGLGYRLVQDLLSFAREKGYKKIRLDTDPTSQKPAYDLYKRLGFKDVFQHPDHPEDVVMEMEL